jgi:hypothetical protein
LGFYPGQLGTAYKTGARLAAGIGLGDNDAHAHHMGRNQTNAQGQQCDEQVDPTQALWWRQLGKNGRSGSRFHTGLQSASQGQWIGDQARRANAPEYRRLWNRWHYPPNTKKARFGVVPSNFELNLEERQ